LEVIVKGTRKYTRYTDEFKAESVKRILKESESVRSVAQDLGISEGVLHSWVNKTKYRMGDPELIAENERLRAELKAQRKELEHAQMERDILKKATAFFAKESK
jgi:transposase